MKKILFVVCALFLTMAVSTADAKKSKKIDPCKKKCTVESKECYKSTNKIKNRAKRKAERNKCYTKAKQCKKECVKPAVKK